MDSNSSSSTIDMDPSMADDLLPRASSVKLADDTVLLATWTSVVTVARRPTALLCRFSSYGGSIGAEATWPRKLSRTIFRLGMHAVRMERPVEACSQTVGQTADQVRSE